MALCERCGSIQITRAHSSALDKAIALVTKRSPFFCRRCGWRGRRSWGDHDFEDQSKLALAPSAAYDPELVALDEDQKSPSRRLGKRLDQKTIPAATAGEFDLPGLNESAMAETRSENIDVVTHKRTPSAKTVWGRNKRARRERRREIIAAIAASALAMILVVLFALTGSCAGNSEISERQLGRAEFSDH